MKTFIIGLVFSFGVLQTNAQHEHHMPPPPPPKEAVKPAPVKKPVIKKASTTKTNAKKPAAKKAAVKKPLLKSVNAKDAFILIRDTLPAMHHDSMHMQHNMQSMDHDTMMHMDHNMQHMDHDTMPSNHAMQNRSRDTMMQMDHTMQNMHHDTTTMHMDHNMNAMDHEMPGMNMSHMYSLSLPMSRNASGTAWNPDNSPMYMFMIHGKKSMWMIHGSRFFRYNNQELNGKTSRGAAKFDAPNWTMAMYNRPVGKNGLFGFSAMISLDPISVGANGYPLLFQSGETFEGKPLVDRQHPHDLFSELAISYSQRINKDVDIFGYLGYPGEPALSAPAFMHRISAMNDPDAPLGHHWQDATHITFGVGTLGVRLGKIKLESSIFTGREPDEHRYDFDKPLFDSYSYRVSFNPNKAWALQVSQGWIKSPEALHPDEDIVRTTASALYATPVTVQNHYFSSAFIWGLNDAGDHHKEHSFLAEGTQQLNKQAVYGRYEFVQKSSEELNLETLFGDQKFSIQKITLGSNRQLLTIKSTNILFGAQLSLNFPPAALQSLYGKTPMAGEVYLQLRPKLNR